jgi:phage gp29-like protein
MATDRQTLTAEISPITGGRDITRGYIDALPFLPPRDTVLPIAGGWRGYEEILRDDQVHACFAQRRLAVISHPWTVEPGGDKRIDKQAADLVRETLARLAWDEITEQMLFARFFGFAIAEIIWSADRSGIRIDDIRVRDRARFVFGPDQRPKLRTLQNPMGEMLPERKFWVVQVGASHHDEPYGRGLAHQLYWPVWFKRNGARYWSIFLEKFGSPTAVGKFPAGTTPEARQKLLEAVEAVQTQSGLVIPQEMAIDLIEASRAGTASYEGWMSYWDHAIAKVILGQTMTTESGASRAQAQVHYDVREDLVRSDADLICESANGSWVRWLVDLAVPGAAYPRIWRDLSDAEDLNIRAERDQRLAQIGWKLTADAMREVYGPGYEAAQDAQQTDLQQGARTPISSNPLTAADQSATPVIAPAQESPTVDERIADAMEQQTEPAWTQILDRIRALVQQAESLPALRDALLAAFGDLPTDRLTEVMAMGFAAADLAGRFDSREDSGATQRQ